MIETPSLLITDDDRSLRETLRAVFEPRGYEIHLAADGVEALHIVQFQVIHILLMDMHMPQLTGLETIRRLRQTSVQAPAILMSAQLDDCTVHAAQQEQVFSVLAKPFSVATILTLVRNALAHTYHWTGR
jgi:CheY-like chemotaxis protein